MPVSLGSELQVHRRQRGLTQRAVADQLNVQRATLAQWEAGRHLPSMEHAHKLDEIYGARGTLAALVRAARSGGEHVPPQPRRSVAEVLRDVADALVALMWPGSDDSQPGWAHNLVQRAPTTPLSTAYVLRTLQMLDDPRVDMHALGNALMARRSDGGWTNRSVLDGRPEVTAVVLAALSRLGRVSDVDESLRQLERAIDDFARSRPYVLAVVLETVLALRPGSPLVADLVNALLEARMPDGEHQVWPANAAAPPGLVEPSVAHTARVTTVLRMALPYVQRPNLNEAVTTATAWIVDRDRADDGVTELLEPVPGVKAADVTVNHFTAAWCLRALAGAEGVPAKRVQDALDTLWSCYDPGHKLWVWRLDAKTPSWMTHDAVAALCSHALATATSPILLSPPQEPPSDRGSGV